MDIQSLLLLGLLFSAVAIGWFMGRSSRDDEGSSSNFNTSYFQGLNYLLDEQPDEAVDAFIEALEVNDETIEVHFVLGQLLRRQGQPDRAIRVHQNLLARTGLTREQHDQAKFELAQDFVNAGLFDRASRIFLELSEAKGAYRQQASRALLDIHLREHDWEAALALTVRIGTRKFGFKRKVDELKTLQVNLCCELCSEALAQSKFSDARRWIAKARSYGGETPRILDLEMNLFLSTGDMARARQNYLMLLANDQERAYYYLTMYARLYPTTAEYPLLIEELDPLIHSDSAAIFGLLQLKLRAALNETDLKLHEELITLLSKFPELGVLDALTQNLAERGCKHERVFTTINEAVRANRDRIAHFKCRSCGFKGQQMHWQCPSCRTWDSVYSDNQLGI